MCGICGILRTDGQRPEERVIQAMTEQIHHRGPDDGGTYVSGPVGLGHRRLSIIDLSHAGHQPMVAEDGRLALVYNGEIYNFKQLRAQLVDEGYVFRSQTDSEVLLHGYRHWGLELLAKLNGMYAFALWDGERKSLLLVRDRFGIKPLYYAKVAGGMVFGSEIKALLESGLVARELNRQSLHETFYFGNCQGDRTMFAGVHKLRAGHYLEMDDSGRCRQRAYWRPEDVVMEERALEEEVVPRLREKLEAAVARQLVADVPVGVFLSGGIDSSAITAFASRLYGEKLKTFSVGFDFDKGVNELDKARRVAETYQTEHHELHVKGGDLEEVLQRLVIHHDEPFSDPANIPLYLLCREIKGQIKVVLQGDGGDEIFGGYRRYSLLSREGRWRWISRGSRILNSILPRNAAFYRRDRMIRALTERRPERKMALLLTHQSPAYPPTRILSKALQEELAAYDPFEDYVACYDRFKHLDPVQRQLYTDTQILLPHKFLEKVDKATMAHSVEVRVPFLDHELTAYAMGLPASMKVKGGGLKWLLRESLRGVVPEEILDGPKTGFGVPYAYWLRTSLAPFMQRVLLDPDIERLGLFDRAMLKQSMDEHISGKQNHGYMLLNSLNLALWVQTYRVGL